MRRSLKALTPCGCDKLFRDIRGHDRFTRDNWRWGFVIINDKRVLVEREVQEV